ncbi:MAG: hypothetical protein RRA94_01885 [Bacteroidota bacterium]|nr:hypothetical protein [Bacteroidota bacterium]
MYYAFRYYYPNTQVSCFFGESVHVSGSGDIDTLSLQYLIHPENERVLCCENSSNLADSSVTSSFVAGAGSIVRYYIGSSVMFATDFDSIDIADTLMLIVQLYDPVGDSVIVNIDSTGYYPCIVDSLYAASAVGTDTNVVRTYQVPSSYSGMTLSLRTYPYYSGHDSLNYFCREIAVPIVKLSEEERHYQVEAFTLVDEILADTTLINLLLSKQLGGGSSHGLEYIDFEISPNPSNGNVVVVAFRENSTGHESGEIVVYSLGGAEILSEDILDNGTAKLNLTGLAAGRYLVVPYLGGRMYRGKPLVVVR